MFSNPMEKRKKKSTFSIKTMCKTFHMIIYSGLLNRVMSSKEMCCVICPNTMMMMMTKATKVSNNKREQTKKSQRTVSQVDSA